MRIKILMSCSGIEFSYKTGDEIEVSAELGHDLVDGGLAKEIKAEVKSKPKAGAKTDVEN